MIVPSPAPLVFSSESKILKVLIKLYFERTSFNVLCDLGETAFLSFNWNLEKSGEESRDKKQLI